MRKIFFLLLCVSPAMAQTTTYTVTENGFAYFLNSQGPNPTIELHKGTTYSFQGSNIPTNHPFAISTSSSSLDVPAGVTPSSITGNSQLTFTPAAVGTFFYVCTVHFFFGQINVTDPTTTAATLLQKSAPNTFSLLDNYPNPFNPETRITFDIPERSDVRLSIVNVLGQEMSLVLNTTLDRGRHSVDWRALAPSGVYYYRLEATSLISGKRFTGMRRMILLK